ncbi:MAG: N-(5'-phosphoribosyl)anthranilate isomerase [Candidatus Muproteobacteria bacterium RIFCSPLOWO2_01_FULL_60_18]|uniref:N-(5'-phosphoribosyl)anthranilate isomerase n=1 Tax=Candidatus Muproteobacteria bacterium RIFCSPLOWO2_01_FULL_60_18 TaxID=1817768 RepID=A0A1F6TXQ8_9PROT|nr:MAG: N-(5'-phosphoribosyl)anthranilate isomerase [Candidatus Muproteobacteria bacterium RIFCSPLOWO2_01_FULL_60_18]
MRTRVKICGITRIEDAIAAAQAGADAIGFVFDPKSPRHVHPDQALKITRALPPFITVVGLFVNPAPDTVEGVLSHVPLDLIQFHGNEKPEQCRRYHRSYIKAIHMKPDVDLHEMARLYGDATGLLLDTYVADTAGGSGQVFDWNRVPHDLGKPLVLAGGLTPENVGEAVRRVRPYAVDVSSGVEQSKGVKDAGKIAAFIEAVRGSA